MWVLGVAAYVVAVMHRTSFGVAGLTAVERFDVSAGTLGGFVVLQLVVYTGMQVPVGVLLDRFGARALVAGGAIVMAGGQLTLALATALPAAMVGRALVGAGDAMTFICVLRVVAAWFSPRRAAFFTQLTGLIGQLGQVLSAVPLAAILTTYGWRPAFGSAAALSVLIAVVVLSVLRDGPPGSVQRSSRRSLRADLADVRTTWRNPGVRLGFWSHFATMFSNVTFVVMWGFPFLQSGRGLDLAHASALVTLLVVASAAASPAAGILVGRLPELRTHVVLAVVGVTAVSWALVLAWPGAAPGWLLVVLMLALAAGGPGSMIGFDFARTSSSPQRLGTATALVNIGGFTASLLAVLAIGVVLDLPVPAEPLSMERFRMAMLVQLPLWLLGTGGIVAASREVARRGIAGPPGSLDRASPSRATDILP